MEFVAGTGADAAPIEGRGTLPNPRQWARRRDAGLARNDVGLTLVGRTIIAVGMVLLFFKLGGVSSPGYGLPKWQPWTWRPGPLFRNTLTTGGDTGAHVWTSTFVKEHLVGSFRVTGWSKDWYAGFPVLHFYFPAPTWAIVLLSYVIPINVAFKLISVSGLFSMPFAAMFFARRARLSALYRYLFGLGALLFLFLSHFEILGGNIISTMAGEFSFAISLSLGLVFLGLLLDVWIDGRHRARAAIVLALTGTSHLLPTLFIGASSLVLLCTHINVQMAGRSLVRRLRDATTVVVAGALLGACWVVPFAARLPYANDMGWERTTSFLAGLLPGFSSTQLSEAPRTAVATTTAAVLLAMVGALASLGRLVRLRRRHTPATPEVRVGIALTVMALLAAAAFCFTPQFRLWNERALPFYYLTCYFLAAFGLVAIGRVLRAQRRKSWALAGVAIVSLWSIGAPLRILPSFVPIPKLSEGRLSIQRATSSGDISSIDDWPAYNYNGYEDQDEWPEFRALMKTMDKLGRTNGCGRAMWEYEDELDRYGTSMGPMLLPKFTNGCIGSMEGLYFESSATTPYHFLNASLLSARSSDPQRGLPYTKIDIAAGVRQLQILGVRYYMAFSPEALRQSRANPDLKLVATAEYSRECDDKEKSEKTCPTGWEIYEVANADVVAGLTAQPVVVTGIGQSQTSGWLDVAVAQYSDPYRFGMPLAADGPRSWPRVEAKISPPKKNPLVGDGVDMTLPPARILPRVNVTKITETNEKVAFHVDRVGIPVVVKVSYFPAWRAVGAQGPWRLAPNLMVVVPTANDVRLEFRRTTVDWLGLGGSFVGVVTVVGLALTSRRRRRAEESSDVA